MKSLIVGAILLAGIGGILLAGTGRGAESGRRFGRAARDDCHRSVRRGTEQRRCNGRMVVGNARVGHQPRRDALTPQNNWQWEKSSGMERQISLFDGIEYQTTEPVAVDFSAQHLNLWVGRRTRSSSG